MAFNPFPFDLMLPQRSIKTLPEIDIFYWFFVCGFPATFFPVMDPLGDTLADILAVGTQNDFAMFFNASSATIAAINSIRLLVVRV